MVIEEHIQRSKFQWDIYRLNLIAGGAIITFALKLPREFEYSLLILPVLSLLLFLYWVHHGLVIRVQNPDYMPRKLDIPEFLRRFTFGLTILGNFAAFPLLGTALYTKKEYIWLLFVDFACLIIISVLFFYWMYVQYSRSYAKKLSAEA